MAFPFTVLVAILILKGMMIRSERLAFEPAQFSPQIHITFICSLAVNEDFSPFRRDVILTLNSTELEQNT